MPRSLATAVVLAGLVVGGIQPVVAAEPAPIGASQLVPRFGDGRDWFFTHRFGLFVHWGLYAIPGWHEQYQWRMQVPRAEYVKLANQWNPVEFNPDAWIDQAQAAGMSYICLTTKHHDGFCLWDSKQTTFTTMHTPYGKDVLRQLADACHRRKFPLCLYFSVVDWNQPNYPNQGRHHELPPQPGDTPDYAKFLTFMKAQVRELCTEYGEIHGFWWDMNVDKTVDRSINAMIRTLQPKAVINNRGFDEGDFGTPEREYDQDADAGKPFTRLTEACNSIGAESWGFRLGEDFYTDRHLERSIASYLARDANYLLNIGPQPSGAFSPESKAILGRIGTWYTSVREAFVGTVPASQLSANRNVMLTRRDNTLYLILTKDPATDAVKLKPIERKPLRATLLNNGQEVETAVELIPSEHVDHVASLRLRKLPVNELANTVLVVKLEFADLPTSFTPPAKPADDLRQR
jgi:alpha-L-fucosidase